MEHSKHVVIAYATLFALLSCGSNSAMAKEVCWREGPTQFADATHYCVSSVLSRQGSWDYGPRNLPDYFGSVGAWCEGGKGHGIGETITIHIERGPAFRRLRIKNGYGKSKTAFRNNGRLKLVRITLDTGINMSVRLRDLPQVQVIKWPLVAPHRWIRLEILAVYPGARYKDTCVMALGPDFVYEEELLARGHKGDPQKVSTTIKAHAEEKQLVLLDRCPASE